jgi:hypothetical protein
MEVQGGNFVHGVFQLSYEKIASSEKSKTVVLKLIFLKLNLYLLDSKQKWPRLSFKFYTHMNVSILYMHALFYVMF